MSFLNYVPEAVTINGAKNTNDAESAEFAEALAKLPPRQARFVKEFLIVGEGAEAARRAGYKTADAKNRAYKLSKIPRIAAALEAGRRDIGRNAQYDANAAMNELNAAAEYAKSRDNPMALTKTIELKMKLCGLLIERVAMEHVDISGALLEAKRRVLSFPPRAQQITDVETVKPFKPHVSDPFGD